MAENGLSDADREYFERAAEDDRSDFPATSAARDRGRAVVDNVNLKPCPFCGGVPEITHHCEPTHGTWGEIDSPQESLSIRCPACSFSITRSHDEKGGILGAVNSWNARPAIVAVIKHTEIEAMIADVRAENDAYLTGRSEETTDIGYKAAVYSMRRLINRLYNAGNIVVEDDSAHPDNQPRVSR